MFYPNYDDYMRDVFYFNGLASSGMGYWNNANNVANLNNLYPSIYRTVFPVVKRVVSGSNFQVINEEIISDAVDTVFGIVDNDTNNSSQNNTSNNGNNSLSKNYNNLLKDLIRILIIRELLNKNNVMKFPYNIPYYMSGQMMMPYMY